MPMHWGIMHLMTQRKHYDSIITKSSIADERKTSVITANTISQLKKMERSNSMTKEKQSPKKKKFVRTLLVTSKYVDLDFFRRVFADVYVPSNDLPQIALKCPI